MWEILSWPVEWSALHGIAEVRTPVFKIAVDTDATARKHVVQLNGSRYPEDGERGLRFPYLNEAKEGVKGSRHVENGFSSAPAMLGAHLNLLNILDPLLDGSEGSILDLGCGTGELLNALGAGMKDVRMVGVDKDERKIAIAKSMLGPVADLYVGNYLDKDGLWLAQRHELAIGTLAFCESEERADVLRHVISKSRLLALHYYKGYRGDVAGSVKRLETTIQALPQKRVTQLTDNLWLIHDINTSIDVTSYTRGDS